MDVLTIRRALRSLRKQHWPNNREAAKAIGLGASTVAKVENVRGEPDYDPGIGIVSAFVAAAARRDSSLTLSSFFEQIERRTDGDLPDSAVAATTGLPPAESLKSGRQGRAAPFDADKLLQAGNALVDAGGLFIAAAKGVEVKPRARARDSAGRSAAGQRRRAGGNR